MTTSTHDSRSFRRKLAAVLAGGLVLGVGSAATLASWNDSEYATASFTAGKFVFQGSTDGTTYSDHNSYPGYAALSFSTPVANLSPGDVVAAPFALRLGAGTTNNAQVRVASLGASGSLTDLTWEIIDTGATFGCTSATTGTTIYSTSTFTQINGGWFSLAKGATATTDGTARNLCFKVTAGAGLVQSMTGSASWQLAATSV